MSRQPLPTQPYDLAPQKVVILDRDGVINEDSDDYIKSLNEWKPYLQAIKAIAHLARHGWMVAVATNQSGIARGYYDEAELARMHERLLALVREAGGDIMHIAYCPHGPDDDCLCRKPRVGLLDEIQNVLKLETLNGAWLVGDSLRDLQAGESKGCHRVLVRTGKGKRTEAEGGFGDAQIFDDLAAFAYFLQPAGSPQHL
ncbi:D-glycero-beta-D-manno-heptose 1,7-bisphosphate 7-phosphatase [Halomonas sp. McH1-25]|uniref:D-glycero-beta-D-manno-heptose 1,7-bisphosphate 7-phosphatase n=1 Tax=unclassified Halomonas TaxID=2609666 RepID=UPI001EF6ECF5|nr:MULTISPECIES: D-glycero-beta-D-manno-heptose 1,7-bisphosphate 7-phosphatase [unclassified Halomonas]MCG7599618.1 D-glycero-beta-D-manno-heptose 1,7-bisphosphate 7-phosphatase [Halomonas sp. McH1-25]MCP1342538.1 D-glycero-beta-D-manno-heptose 1,7-bisphosphate 7-phosphatase [Halomonas sp. FL8]MCP1362922.1 D-glycero-beta-D-manno-heptose 1,7-bisphosphate 7-phosphatase [Halomonas sp. BBD45]MCP1365615.1 D-glycero-beta-D-manno-heptose 1,7-bisphosphate 7-phosphatase [Halomonas sp. BBD48]